MSREVFGFRKEAQRLHPYNEDDNHEGDLSAAGVDDDCDALNDNTFEEEDIHAAGVECHGSVAILEDHAKHPVGSSLPANPLDDEDSLFLPDVVQRSISHLGLHDEEGKPAIMTYSKTTAYSGTAPRGIPRSPPPPVFLPYRSDGSRMMETIWTPKTALPLSRHEQLKPLPWKLPHAQQQPHTQEEALPEYQPPGMSSPPPNVRPEDIKRELLDSDSSSLVPIGSPRHESPSDSGETHAERTEGGDTVVPSPSLARLSGAAMNQGPPSPARSGSVDHRPHVLPGPPSGYQPRTARVRFNPGWSAYPPGTHAGPVLPAPMGMPLQNGQMAGLAHGGMSSGIHPKGFGNRMSRPTSPHIMRSQGKMTLQSLPTLPNNPPIRGRIPRPSNLPGFQPGMNLVSSQPQKTGSSSRDQQPAYQMVFDNPATFAMPPAAFRNRMPLPPTLDPMLGPGGVMNPPSSSMLPNIPAIRGRMPLPSNLPGFKTGMNQVKFDPQSSGSNTSYQQHAYQTVFGKRGRTTFSSPSTGFSSRAPVPPLPNPMLNPGLAMMPPDSAMLPNDPAKRGRMPLSSNLPGFQPGRNQVQTQNRGSRYNYQQQANRTAFGNYGGATLGSPLQTGGVQQQKWRPHPRTQFSGAPLYYRGGRNGSFHQSGDVVAVSNSPTIVTQVS